MADASRVLPTTGRVVLIDTKFRFSLPYASDKKMCEIANFYFAGLSLVSFTTVFYLPICPILVVLFYTSLYFKDKLFASHVLESNMNF